MYKNDFAFFKDTQYTFLDSSASAQKPDCVIDAMTNVLQTTYANVHRGSCQLALNTTDMYHQARQKVADFMHATSDEVIFTPGATESLNLIASSFLKKLTPDDEVLVSIAEHHANFVPWQQLCLKTGAKFVVFNVLDSGELDLEDFKNKLTSRTKIVAVTHLSNVLGVLNPVKDIANLAHQVGAVCVVDGAQSITHVPINVHELGCDFFAFSAHKLYGPTGIGVLYANKKGMSLLLPTQFGGDMVESVSLTATTFQSGVQQFEAGTPPFVEAIGLAAAIDYVTAIGMDTIKKHIDELTQYCLSQLLKIDQVHILGSSKNKQGLISFAVNGIHMSDISFVIAKEKICTRMGHHCAMPIHTYLGYPLSMRISFGIYNTKEDVDTFITALQKAIQFFI